MKRTRILLIEDNPADVLILKMVLDHAGIGHEITTIPDGAEAIAFVRGQDAGSGMQPPEIVLLDVNIPKKDGREILREIRGSATLAAVPVIVLSTSQSPREEAEMLGLRPTAMLAKPSDFDGLLELGRTIKPFFEPGPRTAAPAVSA